MIFQKLSNLTALLSLAIILVGCTDRVAERSGAEIQIVPITYSLGISIKEDKYQSAWEELDSFVENNWDKVSRQTVNLTWYTKSGKRLADSYHAHLLKKGLNRKQLKVSKAVMTEDKPFDLQLQTIVNNVVVEVCKYEKVGYFDSKEIGCYSEGARWQSMVNPEKMITTN